MSINASEGRRELRIHVKIEFFKRYLFLKKELDVEIFSDFKLNGKTTFLLSAIDS